MFQKGHKTNVGRKRPQHSLKMRELYKLGRLKIYHRKEDFTEETKRKISNSLKGRIPWNKGLRGIKTGPKKGFVPWSKGKHLSEETKKKISEARKGKGKREVPLKVIGWRLQKWSKDIILRDKRCMVCGSLKDLEGHHLSPKSLFPERMYDIKNGICLCRICHKKTETYGNRLDLKMKL